jgi:hypothetical protein
MCRRHHQPEPQHTAVATCHLVMQGCVTQCTRLQPHLLCQSEVVACFLQSWFASLLLTLDLDQWVSTHTMCWFLPREWCQLDIGRLC